MPWRARAAAMLAESERLEKELAALIDQLVAFTDELSAETKRQGGAPDAAPAQ